MILYRTVIGIFHTGQVSTYRWRFWKSKFTNKFFTPLEYSKEDIESHMISEPD